MADVRCPIHDEVHDSARKCPRWSEEQDCDIHRIPEEHQAMREGRVEGDATDSDVPNEKTKTATAAATRTPPPRS